MLDVPACIQLLYPLQASVSFDCWSFLQDDGTCELELRLMAKQAEQDSVQERLTNSEMMVSQYFYRGMTFLNSLLSTVCRPVLSVGCCSTV